MELKITIIIFSILLIIFYILNNKLIKKENFLTYYVPFLGDNNNYINKINNFYKNNDNLKNYFKHKFNYNPIIIGSYKEEEEFIKYFMNLLISKTRLYDISNLFYNNKIKLINDLEKNKINIGFTNIPTLELYAKKYSSVLSKIFAITPVYKEFLIIATKLKYRMYNINNIPYGFVIGILDNENTIFYYYKKLLTDLNLDYTDYKIKVYSSEKSLIENFYNNNVNMIMYFSNLPNNNIDKMINYNFEKDIIFIPFNLPKKLFNLFNIKNSFLTYDYFDLNKISESYLPKKFGKYEFVKFRPIMKFLTLDQIMITNNVLDNTVVYDIANFFVRYTKSLNNSLPENVKIPDFKVNTELIKYMNYHPSIVKLFGDFGFQTFEDNENCVYFVGKKKCTKKVLEDNGFI
tara:strand:+ start:206 stop:1417 length:1212 start_codon:yes stop_codon:yes gene_type:complete